VPSLLEPVRVASKRIGAKVAAAATNSLAVNDGAASAPNYFDRKLRVTTGLCSTSARVVSRLGGAISHSIPSFTSARLREPRVSTPPGLPQLADHEPNECPNAGVCLERP
jgi:hypothetical protein